MTTGVLNIVVVAVVVVVSVVVVVVQVVVVFPESHSPGFHLHLCWCGEKKKQKGIKFSE